MNRYNIKRIRVYLFPFLLEPSKQNRLVGPPYPTKLMNTNVKLYLLIDAVNTLLNRSGKKGKKLIKTEQCFGGK